MDGAGDVFDRDDRFDLDDAMVRPEILDRARGTAARYAIREARHAGRLQNLAALAEAGHATLDDRAHMMLTWLVMHTFRLAPTELMPAGCLAARRAEATYVPHGPAESELTRA